MKVDLKQLNTSLLLIDPELPYIRRWVKHLIKYKGLPGFVGVFKSLKAWALQILSGNRDFKVEWFRPSVYRGFIVPRKYRELFTQIVDIRLLLEKDSTRIGYLARKITFLLSAINIYYVVMGPDQRDAKKQISVATSEPPKLTESVEGKYKTLLRLLCYSIEGTPPKLGKLQPVGSSVAIAPGRNGTWKQFVASTLFQKLVNWQSDGFSELIPDLNLSPTPFQGNLTVLGEEGGKTRLVLVGDPFLQAQLKPVQGYLLNILKQIPTDCTFDQTKGVTFLMESTKRGDKPMYSVDLKDATWNFPASLQRYVLKRLGFPRKVIDKIFSLPVFDPFTRSEKGITRGQAMGLGPSFPLFSLTHNLILSGFCNMVGENPSETFRVLGDDVIINSKPVLDRYLQFLKEYEVPISQNKTFVSPSMGEFGGQVMLYGRNITPIKWKALRWNSTTTLYWKYRTIFTSSTLLKLADHSGRIALAVYGPLSQRIGGLGLQLPESKSHKVNQLRCGILESILEGQFNDPSTGVHKIPNWNLEIRSSFRALFTPRVLRLLDTLLVDDSIYRTEWGLLPSLSPNPTRTLTCLGIKRNLIPERVIFRLDEGFRARFRRSKRTDWKDLQILALEKEGYRDSEKSQKDEDSPVEPKVQRPKVYTEFFK